ncbi:MAG: ferredoxin [Phycisphaerae bacterium]|nr:ferredoxin [Phycisphaerae bacterium]
MKIAISEDCTQCGKCVRICPQVFEPDPLRVSTPNGLIPAVFDEQVVDAARTCPVYAIVIINRVELGV